MNKYLSKERGYTLLELSIMMVFMAMVIITAIMMQAEQARMDRARSVAQIYTRMNNAVGGYLTNFYDTLIKLKPECGAPNWSSSGGAKAVSQDYSSCKVDLRINGGPVVTVANGLQPTPTELANLGFLEGAFSFVDNLPFSTIRDASGGYGGYVDPVLGGFLMGDSSRTLLPNRFMVLIQFVCIAGNSTSPALFTTTGGCASNSFDLRSLVFNSQPYRFSGGQDSDVILYQALRAAGADAYLSGYGPGTGPKNDTGELRSVGGSQEPIITNPSRWGGWNVNAAGVVGGTGAPNIFAMRNGYGSSGWDRYVRRDGTTPMTSDWNYGNRDVTNINNLKVNNNATIGGDLNVAGTLKAPFTGIFGDFSGFPQRITAALNATSAFIQDRLTVGGQLVADSLQVVNAAVFGGPSTFTSNLTTSAQSLTTLNGPTNINADLTVSSNAKSVFNGPVDLKGATNIYQFRLNGEDTFGAPCDPSVETLKKQAVDNSAPYNDGLRLLVCDTATKKWVMPQPDLSKKLNSIPNPSLSIQGKSFWVSYFMYGCGDGYANTCDAIDSIAYGTLNTLVSEWDYKITYVSAGAAWLYPKPGNLNYYGVTLPWQYQAGTELDVIWTAKVPKPTTSPVDLTQVSQCAFPTSRTCNLTSNWLVTPPLLGNAVLIDRAAGFVWP